MTIFGNTGKKLGLLMLFLAVLPTAFEEFQKLIAPLVPALMVCLVVAGGLMAATRLAQRRRQR